MGAAKRKTLDPRKAPEVDSMWRAQAVLEYAAGCVATARDRKEDADTRTDNLVDAEVSARAVVEFLEAKRKERESK